MADNASINESSYSQTHYLVKGENVFLPCELPPTGNLMNSTVTWSKKDKKLTNDQELLSPDSRLNVILQFDLELENVQLEDSGTYSCRLNFKADFELAYNLNVYEPHFLIWCEDTLKKMANNTFKNLPPYSQTHYLVKGENVLLPCDFTTTGGLMNGTWSTKNTKLTNDLEIISSDIRINVILQYDLEIKNVQLKDSGTYTCRLQFYDEFKYKLNVYNPKNRYKFKKSSNKVLAINAKVNDTVILPCQAIYLKISEGYTLSWRYEANRYSEKNDKHVFFEAANQKSKVKPPPEGSRLSIISGFTLEIQNVKFEDSLHDYVCNLEDPVSKISYRNITHKLVISDVPLNKTADMCSPSPCGQDGECQVVSNNYPECACRYNFLGHPPDCPISGCKTRANCTLTPHLACLSEKCRNLCEKSCGKKAKCSLKRYVYKCVCPDNYSGDPYDECSSRALSQLSSYNPIHTIHRVYKNETVNLPCETINYLEHKYEERVEWKKRPANTSFEYRINIRFEPRMRLYKQFNLLIDDLLPTDSGYYQCRVKNIPELNIYYKIDVMDTENNQNVATQHDDENHITTVRAEKNSQIVLPCEGFNFNFSDITWEKDTSEQNISHKEMIVYFKLVEEHSPLSRIKILKGKNLEIQNVQPEDAGTYSCFMPFPKQNGRFLVASHELLILDPPSVVRDPCGGNICGLNSDCYVKNRKPKCDCRDKYYRGPKSTCQDICVEKKDCFETTCLSDRCKSLCEKSCQFQPNSICRMKNYRWTCMCDNGFIGNSLHKCLSDNFSVSETCGPECLMLSIGIPILLLLIIIIGTMILIKKNKKKRNHAGTQKGGDMSLDFLTQYIAAHPNIYHEKWEFPRERLDIKECIGEGHFGKVLKAEACGLPGYEGPLLVAVKTLKAHATRLHLEDLISEYELLKDLDHPNVIRLLGVCTKDGPFYIIMEYAENGSLNCYLRDKKKEMAADTMDKIYVPVFSNLSPKEILSFAWQIAKGMSYFAEIKFVHRDLAARNVLLTKDLTCKISDFGLTRDVYQDLQYIKSTKSEVPVRWMAIESLYNDTYSTKSDVWSFGVVLWELITFGEIPYPEVHVCNVYNYLKEGNRMGKPEGCSDEFYQIMLSCWKENPSERPDFQDLVGIIDNMLSTGTYYLQCSEKNNSLKNDDDDDDEEYLSPRFNPKMYVNTKSRFETDL